MTFKHSLRKTLLRFRLPQRFAHPLYLSDKRKPAYEIHLMFRDDHTDTVQPTRHHVHSQTQRLHRFYIFRNDWEIRLIDEIHVLPYLVPPLNRSLRNAELICRRQSILFFQCLVTFILEEHPILNVGTLSIHPTHQSAH